LGTLKCWRMAAWCRILRKIAHNEADQLGDISTLAGESQSLLRPLPRESSTQLASPAPSDAQRRIRHCTADRTHRFVERPSCVAPLCATGRARQMGHGLARCVVMRGPSLSVGRRQRYLRLFADADPSVVQALMAEHERLLSKK
jgi:hypothetical protein